METNLSGSAMVLWSGRLNPLTQIHKSTFLPFQPAPTLILSVDSGLAVSGGQSGASVPEVEASIRMLQFVLPGDHRSDRAGSAGESGSEASMSKPPALAAVSGVSRPWVVMDTGAGRKG